MDYPDACLSVSPFLVTLPKWLAWPHLPSLIELSKRECLGGFPELKGFNDNQLIVGVTERTRHNYGTHD